jgi:predicted methyltransferase
MRPLILLGAVALATTLAACGRDTRPDDAAPASIAARIAQVQAGDWRDPAFVARDVHRHPAQTLEFFGIRDDMTVIEIWPSGGWYTEILAPYLRERGHYIAVLNNPETATTEKNRDGWTATRDKLQAKVAARPDAYGTGVQFVFIDPTAPDLGPAGSADAVLTFRNVHNWVMQGTEADMFEAMFEVLKPGGVLGVVDHRARRGAPAEEMQSSGYLPEEAVIAMAIRAGFRLDARSEINANPKDTADHPKGVWTLPPTLRLGEVDKDKYLAIGESDRMTLRFVKPLE